MEAVCPECQVRYEVSEELLAQGSSIGCPTCGVSLDLIQPDEQAKGQSDGAQSTAAEELSQTDPATQDATSDTQETPSTKPDGDAGQLQWGNQEGSDKQAAQGPDEETEAWGTVPTWGDHVLDTTPEGQIPDPDTHQAEANDAQTQNQATQPSETAADQAQIRDAQDEKAEDSKSETPQTLTQDALNQLTQPAQATQTETTQATSPEAAATDPEQPPEFVQPQVDSLSQSLGSDNTEPGDQDSPEQTDWAAAAAKWAESGFSTENMPDFVKGREAESKAVNAHSNPTPTEPMSDVVSPPASSPILPPTEAKPIEPVNQRPSGRVITPPPLPSVGNANLPSPATKPPPLERQHASYNLQGSGEGQHEPWHQEEKPQPEQPVDSDEPIPLSPPEASDQEIQAAAFTPVTSTMTKVLVMLGTVGVIAIGVWLALHFTEAKLFLFGDETAAEKKDAINSAPAPDSALQPKSKLADSKEEIDKPATQAANATEPATTSNAENTAHTSKKTKSSKVAKHIGKQRKSSKRQRDLALLHYKKGNQAIRRKNFKEAINLFRKALKADRTLAQAHRGLGISYAQLRQNKRACREYRKYLDMLNPDSPEVDTLRKILKGCK